MKIFTKRQGITINLSTEAVVRTIVLIIIALLAVKFFSRVSHQLVLFMVAGFLALALNPAVSLISRHLRIKRRVLATGIAYLIVISLLALFVFLVVPPLVRQSNSFIRSVPNTLSNLDTANSAPARLVRRYKLQPQVAHLTAQAKEHFDNAPQIIFTTAGRVTSVVVSIITVLVLTFMMLVEGPLWLKRLWAITPPDKTKDYQELVHKMYKIVTSYVNGQVLIAAIASLFSFTALVIASKILGVTINAVALAGIVFLFGLVPLIGNTIAAVIVVILSLFVSTPLAVIMAIYFPVYQQIENATLQPHIQAKNNQLTPLLVFMAALIGAGLGGLLGALIAIPAAGCIRVLIEYRYGDKLAPSADKIK